MDRIILGNVSGEEFDAYFKNLNWPGRMAFVRSRRSEIAELANPKILDTLCDYDKGSAVHFAVYLRTELCFCAKVEGGGGIIKNEDLRFFKYRS